MRAKVVVLRKGACALYIKNTVPYILRTDLNIRHKSQGNEFENLLDWIDSSHKQYDIRCCLPTSKTKRQIFPKYLKEKLSNVARESKKVILAGDFNLNLPKFDTNTEVNDFLDLLTRKWFTPHILGSTRITPQDKPSLIDNIFLNFNNMHC